MYYIYDNGWESDYYENREDAFEAFLWEKIDAEYCDGNVDDICLVDANTGEVIYRGSKEWGWI